MSGKRMISIDIGGRNLHIADGRYNGNVVEIDKYCILPTPMNCIINGEVEDAGVLGHALHNGLRENRIKAGDAVVTIQSPQVIVREFDIPYSTLTNLKSMAKYEMEQYLPSGSKEHIYEFRMLQETKDDEGKKCKIRGAAIPKSMVEQCFTTLVKAGLNPVAMDIHSNCISKLFEGDFEVNGKSLSQNRKAVLIDAGHTSTTIHVIADGKLQFSRSIPLGGRDMDTLIASAFSLTLDKAEQKKNNELNLEHANTSSSSMGETDKTVRTVEPFLRSWTSEIQKVLQYFGNRSDQNWIESMFVYGGNADICGFGEYMQTIFNIPTQKLESVRKIKFPGKTANTGCEHLINAAGCMIRQQGGVI